MNRRLTLALAVLASLAPAIALGLGLGDIRLHSALNQPLDAEIDLLAATDDELNSIKVRLATNDQFDRYGIERVAALASFKFDVVKRPDGRAYVHITSDQSLREPFLTFLVEASWPRGRLLREYTVLLDPPVLAPAPQSGYEEPVAETVTASPYAAPVTAGDSSAQTQQPYVQPEPTSAPVIETAVAAAPATAQSGGSAAPTDAQSQQADVGGSGAGFDSSNYGPVRRGETLWAIAARLKPEQTVTMNQMMIAVFRANPDAFRGNINRLKRGAILRIPDASEIQSLSVAEANAEAIRHNDEWQSTRVAVASTPSMTDSTASAPQPELEPQPAPAPVAPVTPPAQQQPTPQPQPTPSAPTSSAPAAVAATVPPSVTIVAPSDDLGAPSTDPAARVAELEKQLDEAKAAGTNTKRKRDRIARLEQELGDARAAVTLQSDALAKLQQQATTPATVPAPTPSTALASTPATEPAATPATVPATPPSHPKKGAFDTLLENLFNPLVLGLLVLVLIGGPLGALGYKKLKAHQATRKAAKVEMESWGESTSDEDKTVVGGDEPTMQANRTAVPEFHTEEPTVMRGPDPALLAATGETVAIPSEQVEKTVMLPRDELDKTIMQTMAVDTRPRAPMTMEQPAEPAVHQAETVVGGTPLKLDENDPMSEADFHMAYGLYDQAADLIKKASQREPARRDLRLKLLEIYFSAGNKGAFVSEAKALRESMGPRPDADWNNVVIFGKQIAPEEGMFNEMAAASAVVDFDASAAGGAPSTSSDLAFDPFAEPAPAAPAPVAAAPAPAPAPAAPVVDAPLEFDLGDFELDTGASKPATPVAPTAPAPERKQHTDSQSDFDKALAELSAFVDTNVPKEMQGAEAAAAGSDLDLGDIQLDDSALEVEDDSASEIDTKLDLARAYIDMMDPGSAKGILEEVLADGDDKQKAEAQKLLKSLG